MGNCLSAGDPGIGIWSWVDDNMAGHVVACDRCKRQTDVPWDQLSSRKKKAEWRVVVLQHNAASLARGVSPPQSTAQKSTSPRNGRDRAGLHQRKQSTPFLIMCAACSTAYQAEVEAFKKERQYYSQAKGMLYPKTRMRSALRRIMTDESWENSASFHATYQPGSTLQGLGEEEEGGWEVGDVDRILDGEGITLVEVDSIEDEGGKEEA